ncbi:MAG: hypothetical protein EB082_19805, partial [Verrucomicrobia bacterium]|nr:hypothetical protein [Verrucomicrobiota bacterium]
HPRKVARRVPTYECECVNRFFVSIEADSPEQARELVANDEELPWLGVADQNDIVSIKRLD